MATGRDGEGFRIADVQRPAVSRGRPGGRRSEPAPPPSAGFPTLEALLESGDVESAVASMRPRYEQLEAMATGGPIRERGLAKKAMAAYERAADLLEHLFETKNNLSKR